MAEGTAALVAEVPVQDLDISEEVLQQFGPEYEEKALVLQGELKLEKISDDATYRRICVAGLEAAANIKAIEAYLEPLKKRRHDSWKRVCEVISSKTEPFVQVKEKAGELVAKYQYEMEQARIAAEEAERKRIAEEEAKNREAQANNLANEGRVEEGIAVLEAPIISTAPVVSSSGAPKVKGVRTASEKHKAVVFDVMALVKAVAEGKVPLPALQPDQSWLNKQANQLKQFMQYPGVKVERDFSTGFTSK